MTSPSKRDIALVVDDSPETLRMLTDALEDAGITVLIARDGEKAIDLVGRVIPDVILMDAVMPGLDGFETTKQLRKNQQLQHVPVIFMTGLSETEHIVKGLQAGGVDYVTKPIFPDELIARIVVHLANARLAMSARAALDISGQSVMAVTENLTVQWFTPQAADMCAQANFSMTEKGSLTLPTTLKAQMANLISSTEPRKNGKKLLAPDAEEIEFIYIGKTGSEEFLFRIASSDTPDDVDILQEKLAITKREAEVLLWISQGKSNKDIADILGVSPRTVNKHLEQIFVKLGVENRTAAATLAVRTTVAA